MRKPRKCRVPKREGDGVSPLRKAFPATSKQPGRTGTGAPVTEQLRYRFSGELGWYREHLAPKLGARCIILNLFMEGISK